VCGDGNKCRPCTGLDATCSFHFQSGDRTLAPGCNTGTGRCVPCLAGRFCEFYTDFGFAEGRCQADNTTCSPITCDAEADCMSGRYCNMTINNCVEDP
jgi:hypothetical protein